MYTYLIIVLRISTLRIRAFSLLAVVFLVQIYPDQMRPEHGNKHPCDIHMLECHHASRNASHIFHRMIWLKHHFIGYDDIQIGRLTLWYSAPIWDQRMSVGY